MGLVTFCDMNKFLITITILEVFSLLLVLIFFLQNTDNGKTTKIFTTENGFCTRGNC